MHLVEALALRTVPGAGVFLSITRRCPLHCAHCSTGSTMRSEQLPAEALRRLVNSFTMDDHPRVVSMTGGEPLLRPALVRELADRAHATGCTVDLLSGMFFAREGRIPPAIRRAIDTLDHFSASLDAFHEREVSRTAMLSVLRELVGEGADVSVQLTGLAADDPYLPAAIDDIRETLDDRVPIWVTSLVRVGRAADWMPESEPPEPDVSAAPCPMAAWPVVAFDGTVTACCNQTVVDGAAAPHLRLGHIGADGWPELRGRLERSSLLRAIRTFGPQHVAAHEGSGACSGYCETCLTLSGQPGRRARVEALMERPASRLIEDHVAGLQRRGGAVGAARSLALPQFAPLVMLGRRQPAPA
ncbi:MAG: radical SAM protein [Gaiellales bacterium]